MMDAMLDTVLMWSAVALFAALLFTL